MKATGPDQATRDAVYARDGYRCIICGGADVLAIHHRRPRRMGGSRDPRTNGMANLLLLCEHSHSHVESHRTESYDLGLLVRAGDDPADVPVEYRGQMCWLTDGGAVLPVESDVA